MSIGWTICLVVGGMHALLRGTILYRPLRRLDRRLSRTEWFRRQREKDPLNRLLHRASRRFHAQWWSRAFYAALGITLLAAAAGLFG